MMSEFHNIIMFKILTIISLILAVSAKLHPEAKLPFVEYCQYFNYPVEEHVI